VVLLNKVILLGIDGATFDLIRPWIEKGELPTFGKMFHGGTHGNLETTVPCMSIPAIPSLFTGVNPARLGVFDFHKGDNSLVTYDDIEEESVWDILADNGVKCCVVNLTGTYPPRIRNGVMIAGGAPSERSDYVYPKGLKPKVSGFYSDFDSIKRLSPHEDRRRFLELAKMVERNRWRIFRYLMENDSYGLGILWIMLSDDIQHYYWGLEEIVLEYYREVDKIIGELVGLFQDYNILIVSDHGFSSRPMYNFHINSWLREKGYLKLEGGRLRNWFSLQSSNFLRYLWKWLPDRVKHFLLDLLPSKADGPGKKKLSSRRDFLIGVDWKNTAAYVDATSWGIRVNASNQDQYEHIRSQIIGELASMKDSDGNPIMQAAWRREDLFSGRYLNEIPDIVLLPSANYTVNQFLSTQPITSSKRDRNLRGDHTNCRNGIFIANGPIFKKGHQITRASILDMTPTILHVMGCPVPEGMDGKVMKDIFEMGSEPTGRDVQFQSRGRKPEMKRELTSEETRQIEERLKALGYLG